MSSSQKVRFHRPRPENAAYEGLKKVILELDGQEMSLKEGLQKLRAANKTNFAILDEGGHIYIKIEKVRSWYGLQDMALPLIYFEKITEKKPLYYMSISEARKKFGETLKLVEGEDNNSAVVLTKRGENRAVIIGIERYTLLIAMYNRMLEVERDPEKFLRQMKSHERFQRGDSTGTIEYDDKDCESIEQMREKNSAFEKIVSVRVKEEEDFQLAKEKLEKDLSEFEWFLGIKRRVWTLVVVVSDLEQAKPFVKGYIDVPFGAKPPRISFLVEIEKV